MIPLINWYYLIDTKISDGKINTNHYFTTVSIYFLIMIGAWYSYWRTGDALWLSPAELFTPGWTSVLGVVILVMLANIAESIFASSTPLMGIARGVLVTLLLAVGYALGSFCPIAGVLVAVVTFVGIERHVSANLR